MKRKLRNFNTMDFLFFLVAIYPLVFPLFCMLCSALSTESTTLINFNFDTNFFPITYLDNINIRVITSLHFRVIYITTFSSDIHHYIFE